MLEKVIGRGFLALALVASVTCVRANIVYDIVDYPASQTDQSSGDADHVSGEITTDGTLGSLPNGSSHFVSCSFTVTTPSGASYSMSGASNSFFHGSESVLAYATPTMLEIPSGDAMGLGAIGGDMAPNSAINSDLYWNNDTAPYYDAVNTPTAGGGGTYLFFTSSPSNSDGSIGENNPWIIASVAPVPEPASLTLLGSALLGLGVVCLRRRGAKT